MEWLNRYFTRCLRLHFDDQSLLGLFAEEQDRLIRFYPGGDLMDFLHSVHNSESSTQAMNTQHSSLAVRWLTMNNRTSLFNLLSGMSHLCSLFSLPVWQMGMPLFIFTHILRDSFWARCSSAFTCFPWAVLLESIIFPSISMLMTHNITSL